MHNAVMLAFTGPTSPQTENAYNAWYDDKHLPDVANIPGVIRASRYKLVHDVETLPGVTGPHQRYLAIYELTATTKEELSAFCDGLRAALADGRADIDVTLDMADLGASIGLPIGESLRGVSA
ncbi:DUF4286 family protein [Mycobacterium sp. E1747]|uniref:DUF4286 family protein n=1 Tax=Mycobacterium sp. E1747 TaxID=1834128 RepID=UPI000800EA91|nr:DUF4286 family protein [Mycobacterium sp. E1747]OBH11128.1 hypothetical protein A5695_20180 [Mycobacterium sp. E1747]